MNVHQARTRTKRIQDDRLDLRNHLWPNIDQETLWVRKDKTGYTTIPRAMSLILHIMDGLSEKGKPVASTYFALWCRVFDECFVNINSPQDMAFEAGFAGQRRETTWSSRMKILCDLEFIDAKPGKNGKYNYVLIFNPYKVIKKKYAEKMVDEEMYSALLEVCQRIGANDLK